MAPSSVPLLGIVPLVLHPVEAAPQQQCGRQASGGTARSSCAPVEHGEQELWDQGLQGPGGPPEGTSLCSACLHDQCKHEVEKVDARLHCPAGAAEDCDGLDASLASARQARRAHRLVAGASPTPPTCRTHGGHRQQPSVCGAQGEEQHLARQPRMQWLLPWTPSCSDRRRRRAWHTIAVAALVCASAVCASAQPAPGVSAWCQQQSSTSSACQSGGTACQVGRIRAFAHARRCAAPLPSTPAFTCEPALRITPAAR